MKDFFFLKVWAEKVVEHYTQMCVIPGKIGYLSTRGRFVALNNISW